MTKPFRAVFLSTAMAVSSVLVPINVAAETVPAQDAAAELQQKLASLDGFHADFVQRAYDFDGLLVQESNGTVAVQAPLRFSWEQLKPDPLKLISDGSAVWYYDPYVEQVTVTAITEVIDQTPLPLLSSQDPALWKRWQVEAKQGCFGLTQADNNEISMQICFTDETIERLEFVDGQGNRTEMQLTEFTIQEQAESQFQFTPPEGTYVDDQRIQ